MRFPRRLTRVSLRAALLLFVLLSALLAHRANRAHHQRQAIRHIERLGGSVNYDYEFDSTVRIVPGQSSVAFSRRRSFVFQSPAALIAGSLDPNAVPPAASVAPWAFFDPLPPHRVTRVVLHGDHVTDQDLENLRHLPDVEFLLLGETAITDDGLKHLRHLPNLSTLNITGCEISDAGYGALGDLPQLRCLMLADARDATSGINDLTPEQYARTTNLTKPWLGNDALAHLSRIRNLEFLTVGAAGITDEGLVHLERLNKLQVLKLHSTHTTLAARARLAARLPNLKIAP